MKTSISCAASTRMAMLSVFFLIACSDPASDPVPPQQNGNENEEEVTPEKADAILETFSFASATKTTGTPPTAANTSLIRTATKDTIFTMPGIKDMIRISHPKEKPIKGIYFALEGSTYYYDITVDHEEKSDTVSIIIFEIDPNEIENEITSGSSSVPLEITAYDENNTPIDIIERILTIEKPSANECDILDHIWFWEWSVILNHEGEAVNINCSDERYINDFVYQDCCLGAAFCPKYDANQQPVYDVNLKISLFYSISSEWIQFYSDGLLERETREFESYISNPGDDAATFDPCEWKPETATRVEAVTYWGTHTYNPGSKSISYTITDDSCPPGEYGCGFGGSLSNAEVLFTCHQMMISRGTEQKSIRMFTRGEATEDMEGEILDSSKFWD
jgi:hypothetical protein